MKRDAINQSNDSLSKLCYLFQLMATKIENRVGVNLAIFRSNPWRQFIVFLEICCKDTNLHENVENKISDFWLHKAQNVRTCHKYSKIISNIPFSKIPNLINIKSQISQYLDIYRIGQHPELPYTSLIFANCRIVK